MFASRKTTSRIILICLLLMSIGLATKIFFLSNKNDQLKKIIIDNNQILGSIFDTRSDKDIEQDDLKEQNNTFSFIEWQAAPSELDLIGWDDLTLENRLTDITDEFDEFVVDLKQLFQGEVEISYRKKTLSSLIGKLKERNKNLEALTLRRVGDLGGARLVFTCRKDIEMAVSKIKSIYNVVSEEDYYAHPKPRGYRSFHIAVNYKNLLVEIQLRTVGIQIWSTWDHDLLYKNSKEIIDLVGQKKLDEFNKYSKQFIDYVAQIEEGRSVGISPPRPPKGTALLWELANEEVKKIMTPAGIPNLSLFKGESCELKQ